ncbi:hypothetical protein MHBO_003736 [Bonamia ostreae]|uniref:Uncharacterized protein n=1 Tax=Bonamia ostreae TaxID=126728 RepID=A0ABV2ARF4_9EUKA
MATGAECNFPPGLRLIDLETSKQSKFFTQNRFKNLESTIVSFDFAKFSFTEFAETKLKYEYFLVYSNNIGFVYLNGLGLDAFKDNKICDNSVRIADVVYFENGDIPCSKIPAGPKKISISGPFPSITKPKKYISIKIKQYEKMFRFCKIIFANSLNFARNQKKGIYQTNMISRVLFKRSNNKKLIYVYSMRNGHLCVSLLNNK